MEPMLIDATERSPEISFDFVANNYLIRGESYPEDVNEFFGKIIEALEKHFATLDGAVVNFTFELIYFNSSTAKILMGLFELLDATAAKGNTVNVAWKHEEEDDNMQELGEEFGEDLEHAKFQLISIES